MDQMTLPVTRLGDSTTDENATRALQFIKKDLSSSLQATNLGDNSSEKKTGPVLGPGGTASTGLTR